MLNGKGAAVGKSEAFYMWMVVMATTTGTDLMPQNCT